MGRAALASLVLVALMAAGCGGSKQSSGSGPARPLTELDLINIIGPEPSTPQGAGYTTEPSATTITLADLRRGTTSAEGKATVAAFAKAGFRRIYQRSFNGPTNSAVGTAYLFGTAGGAAEGFTVLERTLEKPASVDQRVTPVKAGNLGEQAWAAHVAGDSEGGMFVWRRGDVVVVADMSCDQTCGFDVVDAARTYAAEIDARAKDVSS